MFYESAVIILLIAAVLVGLIRQRKYNYVKVISPLFILPITNILLLICAGLIGDILPNSWNIIISIVYSLAFIVSIFFTFKLKNYFKDKKYSVVYVVSVILFLGLLLFIYFRENILL